MNYQNAYIRIPSWLPIPGTTIVRTDGESEPFELPAYMGQSFTELCRLTPLINEMLHEYHDSGDGIASTKRASFSFAQGLYARMLSWADDLPVSMARGDDMLHHASIVHIYFHTAVLDLFRPFPYQQLHTPFRLLAGSGADNATPEGICDASVNQLKHLILMVRSKYACAAYTMLWQNALLYVANACLPLQRGDGAGANERMEDVVMTTTTVEDGVPAAEGGESAADEPEESEEDAQRRKWFTACIDALRALAPQFGIAAGIVQGILSMAILKGSILAVEGRAIMDQLKADTEISSRHRRAHFPAPGAAVPSQAVVVDGKAEDVEASASRGDADSEREGSEAVGRVAYGSSGGIQGGDGAGRALNGLVNLPGAQRGGNGFVIDLNEASVNPSAASLDVLARAFDELAMFDEFTTVEE